MLHMGLAKVYQYIKFEGSIFTGSRFMEEGLKFKILALDPDHAPFGGYFVMLEMGLAKVYPYTELEVSCFTRSRFTEVGLKFKNSAPGP